MQKVPLPFLRNEVIVFQSKHNMFLFAFIDTYTVINSKNYKDVAFVLQIF